MWWTPISTLLNSPTVSAAARFGVTGRINDVDKDTVCDGVDRAGRHCRAVTTYLFDTLHITECQLDELCSFVRKKEAHLTIAEKVLALYGDAWVWIAFAPAWLVVAAFVVV